MRQTAWFERKFPVLEDNGLLPVIIERLTGTPARLEELAGQLNSALLLKKNTGKWTIQEEIGHLSDLEPLWAARLEDLKLRLPELTVADLTNQATTTANHNAAELRILLERFREQRQLLVNSLAGLSEEQLHHSSLHPRLKTPMRVIDLAYFVAEHDDHHLARIRSAI